MSEGDSDPGRAGGGGSFLRDNAAWIFLGLVVLGWMAYLALRPPGGGMAGMGGLLPPPDLGDPGLGRLTEDWTFLDLGGRPVSLSSFRGKPVLLNVWATWCGPCIAEMPSVEALASNPRLKEKGIAVLAVSANEPEDVVRRFAAEKKLSAVRVLRAEQLPPAPLATDGIPATFILAPDGRIAAAHVGSAQWDDPSVVEFLERLAVAPAP